MKTRIILLFIAATLWYSIPVVGQSMLSLITPTGQFLVADENVSPPSNEVTVAALSDASQLKVLTDGKLAVDPVHRVKSFKMTFAGKDGNITIDSDGENLVPEMYAQMKKLQKGDHVFVEYIKTVSPDGTTRARTALKYVIR